MTLVLNNLMPGQLATRESVEKKLTWGPLNTLVIVPVVLNSTTVDARSTVTTDLLPGLVLGQITSTEKRVHYSATATNGSAIAQGVLAHPVQMLSPSGVAADQMALMIVGGPVKAGECGGIDQFSRSHMFGRILFDDDFPGNSSGWRDVVAKTGDYTVTAADNNRIFTNQGAAALVTFTLPTIAKGLRYRFYCEDNDGVKIQAATADTIVTHNDAAADAVAFSTTGRCIGTCMEIFANADATAWLCIPSIWNIADDGSTTSKATVTT